MAKDHLKINLQTSIYHQMICQQLLLFAELRQVQILRTITVKEYCLIQSKADPFQKRKFFLKNLSECTGFLMWFSVFGHAVDLKLFYSGPNYFVGNILVELNTKYQQCCLDNSMYCSGYLCTGTVGLRLFDSRAREINFMVEAILKVHVWCLTQHH